MANSQTDAVNCTNDDAPVIEQRWVTRGAIRYHYRVAGDTKPARTPLVLVHGLGVSSAYWGRIQPLLARRRPVYAPDLPGFGLTTKPRRLLDTVELAQVLADWLAAMRLSPVHLMGHSMGGQIVAECARAHPAALSRAILVGSTIGTHGPRAPRQALGLVRDSAGERGDLLRLILRDYLRAGPRRVLGTDMRADDDNTVATVARLTLPLLIVRGGKDTVVSMQDTRHLLDAAPHAVYREIAGGPHAVQWSQPHELAAIVDEFLESDESPEPGAPNREP